MTRLQQGVKAENKHGGTYGMFRDGEDHRTQRTPRSLITRTI
jgi:hypothetical protein